MGVGGKGSGTIRDDAATREDASRVFFRGGALPTGDVVPFHSSRAPFRFAWRSTPPRTGPRRGRFAARRKGGEEGRYDVRVGRPVRETRSATRGVVPSRIGVSCATFENVSFFQARTEGCSCLNVCVVAHDASACQTDASASAAKIATARCIVRVMACRSICLLPPEERGAKNPTCDAFDCKIRRLFVVTFRRVPPSKERSGSLARFGAAQPHNRTRARLARALASGVVAPLAFGVSVGPAPLTHPRRPGTVDRQFATHARAAESQTRIEFLRPRDARDTQARWRISRTR